MMMTSSDVCGAKDLILSRFHDLDKLSLAGPGQRPMLVLDCP